jgi:hypothetical protein
MESLNGINGMAFMKENSRVCLQNQMQGTGYNGKTKN